MDDPKPQSQSQTPDDPLPPPEHAPARPSPFAAEPVEITPVDDVQVTPEPIPAPPEYSVDGAIDFALAHPGGPVVIADTTDNAGGGAPSDNTTFLHRLIAPKFGDRSNSDPDGSSG